MSHRRPDLSSDVYFETSLDSSHAFRVALLADLEAEIAPMRDVDAEEFLRRGLAEDPTWRDA